MLQAGAVEGLTPERLNHSAKTASQRLSSRRLQPDRPNCPAASRIVSLSATDHGHLPKTHLAITAIIATCLAEPATRAKPEPDDGTRVCIYISTYTHNARRSTFIHCAEVSVPSLNSLQPSFSFLPSPSSSSLLPSFFPTFPPSLAPSLLPPSSLDLLLLGTCGHQNWPEGYNPPSKKSLLHLKLLCLHSYSSSSHGDVVRGCAQRF